MKNYMLNSRQIKHFKKDFYHIKFIIFPNTLKLFSLTDSIFYSKSKHLHKHRFPFISFPFFLAVWFIPVSIIWACLSTTCSTFSTGHIPVLRIEVFLLLFLRCFCCYLLCFLPEVHSFKTQGLYLLAVYLLCLPYSPTVTTPACCPGSGKADPWVNRLSWVMVLTNTHPPGTEAPAHPLKTYLW